MNGFFWNERDFLSIESLLRPLWINNLRSGLLFTFLTVACYFSLTYFCFIWFFLWFVRSSPLSWSELTTILRRLFLATKLSTFVKDYFLLEFELICRLCPALLLILASNRVSLKFSLDSSFSVLTWSSFSLASITKIFFYTNLIRSSIESRFVINFWFAWLVLFVMFLKKAISLSTWSAALFC